MLNYEFPPLGGGAGNATYELVRALGSVHDLEIVVVTSSVAGYEVKRNTLTPNSVIHYLPIGKERGTYAVAVAGGGERQDGAEFRREFPLGPDDAAEPA